MAVFYDVTGHPMLSRAAALMGATELAAHNLAAEVVLGFRKFTAIPSTDDRYAQAVLATALQVSYQAESGIEAFVLSNVTRGARRLSYRGGRHRMPVTHSLARKIANSLKPPT